MAHRKHLVHLIADCRDCDWRCEEYLTGQRKAREHANRHGHRVSADLGYIVEYGPSKKEPTND